MGFMEAVRHVFQNYATFSGRARRSEYWYFTLFNVLVEMVGYGVSAGSAVGAMAGAAYNSRAGVSTGLGLSSVVMALLGIYSLVIILPSLAVTCRRLHDVGKPGSYILFILIPMVGPILLLVWELQDSMPGENQYGPNPKDAGSRYEPVREAVPAAPAEEPYTEPVKAAPVQPAPRTAPPERSYALQGVSGVYSGRRIPLSTGSVLVGRGKECQILFPDSSSGVSRLHCEITNQAGSLYIRDLGSSYGTYLNGNRRLAPRQYEQLRPGDHFLIGSDQQMFTVTQ